MGDLSELKRENMLLLLRSMLMCEPQTKKELVEKTGFKLSTVYGFIRYFQELGLIYENGISPSQGGRRAAKYSLNPNFYYIVGITMFMDRLETFIFDLNLNIYSRSITPTNFSALTVSEGIDAMKSSINAALISFGKPREQYLGIGINIPGPTNPVSGNIIWINQLEHWRNIPLRPIIEKEFNMPVFIDKTTCSAALALKLFKQYSNSDCFVFISTEGGLGFGINWNGENYYGYNGSLGGLGHISIAPHGPLCQCGNRGCIELYANSLAPVFFVSQRLRNGESSLVSQICNQDYSKIDINMILAADQQGDILAHEELENCINALAQNIINVIKVYGANYIIIEHLWLSEYPELFNKLLYTVRLNNFVANQNNIKIELNTFKDIIQIGAGAIVLNSQFKSNSTFNFIQSNRVGSITHSEVPGKIQ